MVESNAAVDRNRLMSPRDVAMLLNVSERTVIRMASSGEISGAVKVRKQWRFNRAKVEQFAGLGE